MAGCRKDTTYKRLSRRTKPVCRNFTDFADLYSQHGQPGQPPFRLALAPVLRFIEGLPDRGAADAVRGRIDWKYLLCLELDDPGFDHSVLCEFRTRLLEGGLVSPRASFPIAIITD
jgi:transposase